MSTDNIAAYIESFSNFLNLFLLFGQKVLLKLKQKKQKRVRKNV